MTNDIYTSYNIDKSKLKRDYLENPLKDISMGKNGGSMREKPFIEDFVYLYSILTMNKLSVYFKTTIKTVRKWRKDFNIEKNNEISYTSRIETLKKEYGNNYQDIINKHSQETKMLRYGNPFYYDKNKAKETFEKHKEDTNFLIERDKKSKETRLIRYGSKTFNNTDKIRKTKLERYGNEKYNNIEKIKHTNSIKYGVPYFSMTDEYNKRMIEHNQKIHGVDWFFQSETFKDISKNSCIEKYNAPHYSMTDEYRDRMINLNNLKYGVDWFFQSKEYKNYWKDEKFVNDIIKKSKSTMMKNRTTKYSKEELYIYECLKTKFENVKHSYIDYEKYPFECDFYIPEIDTYIEYNGHWTHGPKPYHEPFNENNPKHIEVLKVWVKKDFLNPIKTWTIRDPLKRQTAKNNGLNYLEFFTIDEFNRWFDNLSL